MKNLYLSIFIVLLNIPNSITQTEVVKLSTNSMRAIIANDASFMYYPGNASHGYSFKNDTTYSLIFSNKLYFGGYDQFGEFHFTGMTSSNYYDNDLSNGPVSNNYNDSTYIENYGSGIWKVSKQEIINHVLNYTQVGYVVPPKIQSWPANGNTSLGVDNDLAPYIDFNGNGFYDPENGDYPCIKGDEAVYLIYNDDAQNDTLTEFEKVGLEIHMMFYQYQTNDYLDSTTFMSLRIKNVGPYSYDTLNIGMYSDMDVGYSENNYIGTDSIRNLVYTYKSNPYDTTVTHPAVGLLSLDLDISYALPYFRFNYDDLKISPLIGSFDGRLGDSTLFHYGGSGYIGHPSTSSQITGWAFTGDPYTGVGWSELNIDGLGGSNDPSDRRILLTQKKTQFNPFSSMETNYAFIVNRTSTYLENTALLKRTADSVKNRYLTELENEDCTVGTKGLSDDVELIVYTNPATDNLVYRALNLKNQYVRLLSLEGELLSEQKIFEDNTLGEFDLSQLSAGIYLVSVNNISKKIVKL